MLRKVVKRSKIQRPIWPYLMRHSSATDSADSGLTESQLDEAYGWTQGSKSPKTYIHLTGRSVKKAMLQRAGIISPQTTRKVSTCPRCGLPVAKDVSLCPSCGSVTDIKAALEIQRSRDALRSDVENLKREIWLLRHPQYTGLSHAEIDKLMIQEEKLLGGLKKRGLVVEIDKHGNIIKDGKKIGKIKKP
jgi:hypothetical protein